MPSRLGGAWTSRDLATPSVTGGRGIPPHYHPTPSPPVLTSRSRHPETRAERRRWWENRMIHLQTLRKSMGGYQGGGGGGGGRKPKSKKKKKKSVLSGFGKWPKGNKKKGKGKGKKRKWGGKKGSKKKKKKGKNYHPSLSTLSPRPRRETPPCISPRQLPGRLLTSASPLPPPAVYQRSDATQYLFAAAAQGIRSRNTTTLTRYGAGGGRRRSRSGGAGIFPVFF